MTENYALATTLSAIDPLPTGFHVVPDASVRLLPGNLWWGGTPSRVLRLTPAGSRLWQQLEAGPVTSRAAGVLARRLTDAGLAHPRPPRPETRPNLTVVIPIRDRAAMLARCLDALGEDYPVVVIDDGSDDPVSLAAVADRPGVTLIRHDRNRGPAAARNTALRRVRTELIAFLDSDCVPEPDWIDSLAGHFADPVVAAVAPRIVTLPTGKHAHRCGLDLGERPARVQPQGAVAYVPTAALLVRRGAVLDVGWDGEAFDPDLRVGEDVDLVWRLHEAGWRVRYDPAVRVAHEEPAALPRLLARRFRYGTSAAPLAHLHPGSVPPLIVHPWAVLTVFGLLARRPSLALAGAIGSAATVAVPLDRAGVPADLALGATASGIHRTAIETGRYATQFAAPLVLAAALPGGRRRWGRRLAVAALLLATGLRDGAGRRPLRTAAHRLADDVAYGAGVYTGCVRHRTWQPLRPKFVRPRMRGN
ncbi:mycofactocin biosynthesis glycosyltransferase MftF [Nocardia aurantia]|uniref:Putative mycofactocin biosynthesis glycosyltransferase MftF n=1 Tax=Nocardia aurantia TaxID=2585199 RepID=A0A7K0DS15_9NOCA|nr:mycofactocin biosynthesis glycosyltransferase MftF [Nocardia aurantia]MQY27604.1 putative mycofactocin biosynthesis glycosyltransferase MftF [Nocardia aurantia]